MRLPRIVLAGVALLGCSPACGGDYTNPLPLDAGALGMATTCADPTVIRSGAPGDDAWYLACTADPLSGGDRDASGALIFRRIPLYRSTDLISWIYVGEALGEHPSWASPGAGLWAPEFHEVNGTYFLYFSVTNVRDFVSQEPGCASDSAIGVATAASPAGPWSIEGSPVVPPRRAGPGCDFLSTIDPEVATAAGQDWIFFGSYSGGIVARALLPGGLSTLPASQASIASSRFEGAEVVERAGSYYLFVSANACCSGDLSGYSVFVGRSSSVTGPYLDRDGKALDEGRSGGTPILGDRGGRWSGPGHVGIVEDPAGQSWMFFHAIERDSPFLEGEPGFTRRPAMLDRLTWDAAGWPSLRGGFGPSECAASAPALDAQPGDPFLAERPDDESGALLPGHSDDFEEGLDESWSWIREPPAGSWAAEAGVLRIDTQATELFEDSNSAALLVRDAPAGDFVAEVELELDLPAEGCCWDFAQAGLVVYGDDDRYLKLVHVSIGDTRQTEFGKELPARGPGWSRYGGSGAGPPGARTTLRVVRRTLGEREIYTAYTRAEGGAWVRGSSWNHELGPAAKLGLVAMNRAGFSARFDDFRVYELARYPCEDPLAHDPCRPEPGDTSGLGLTRGAVTRLAWPALGGADSYDVSRSAATRLAPGWGAETCLAGSLAATELVDGELPPPGESWIYFVRGRDELCERLGSWGRASAGNERSGACP